MAVRNYCLNLVPIDVNSIDNQSYVNLTHKIIKDMEVTLTNSVVLRIDLNVVTQFSGIISVISESMKISFPSSAGWYVSNNTENPDIEITCDSNTLDHKNHSYLETSPDATSSSRNPSVEKVTLFTMLPILSLLCIYSSILF